MPAGAAFVKQGIRDALAALSQAIIDLPRGYNYSGHHKACAAALPPLVDTYDEERLLMRGKKMLSKLEAATQDLKGAPKVIDIRNTGLVGAIEFAPRARATPGRRAHEGFLKCWEDSVLVGAGATASRSRHR